MSLTIYKTTPCNIPEERIPQARNCFGKLPNFVGYCALDLYCAGSAIDVPVNIYQVRRLDNFYIGDAAFLLAVNKEDLRCPDVSLALVFGSSVCHSYQFYLRNLPSGSGAWNNCNSHCGRGYFRSI
jgi:hypothetical protein